jgi:hypothetical protein
MSHVRAVQDALLDGVDRLLLLEDDIFFHDRSPKWLERLMHDVPKDWDQIYLGGQHLKEATPLSGTPYIWRARNINRTHAYALHRRVFAKFLQHVLHAPDYIRRGAWHIDHQLGLAHERGDWRTYTPAWWLCAQEEGGSSISGKINPRMWWQPFIYAKQLPFVYFPHEGTAYEPSLHFEDGFEEALKNNTMLQRWLDTAALNALNRYKLPAWRSTVPALERITAMWPAGVRDAENCDLNALAAYPENGLFIHPLTQAPSTTVELSPGFAA